MNRRHLLLLVLSLSFLLALPAMADQCESNYQSLGSLRKGKTYATFAEYAGVEPAVALRRLTDGLTANNVSIESVDDATGTIQGQATIGGDRTAPIVVKALPVESGTRVELSISLPRGVVGTAATKKAICRFVDLARVDPEDRYAHPLISFVQQNEESGEKVAVVESRTGRRVARMFAGAAVGAIAGALHAKVTGGDVAKEALIGAFAGGAVMFAISKIQDRRLADREQTMLAENYDPEQGYRAGIRDVTVSPEVVKPGGTITVVTRYWALTPRDDESFDVFRYAGISMTSASDDFLRGFRFSPEPFQFSNGGGEFETTMEVTLPESVSPGAYDIHWVLDGLSTGGNRAVTFQVEG